MGIDTRVEKQMMASFLETQRALDKHRRRRARMKLLFLIVGYIVAYIALGDLLK